MTWSKPEILHHCQTFHNHQKFPALRHTSLTFNTLSSISPHTTKFFFTVLHNPVLQIALTCTPNNVLHSPCNSKHSSSLPLDIAQPYLPYSLMLTLTTLRTHYGPSEQSVIIPIHLHYMTAHSTPCTTTSLLSSTLPYTYLHIPRNRFHFYAIYHTPS